MCDAWLPCRGTDQFQVGTLPSGGFRLVPSWQSLRMGRLKSGAIEDDLRGESLSPVSAGFKESLPPAACTHPMINKQRCLVPVGTGSPKKGPMFKRDLNAFRVPLTGPPGQFFTELSDVRSSARRPQLRAGFGNRNCQFPGVFACGGHRKTPGCSIQNKGATQFSRVNMANECVM